MQGWIVPPPKEPTKTKEQLKRERARKVRSLIKHGYLKSERIKNAMLKVRGDGGLGYPEFSPYDRICITAACAEIPPPLLEQLKVGGRLIAPVMERGIQCLMLHEKREKGFTCEVLCEVLYVSLRGKYGRCGKPAL